MGDVNANKSLVSDVFDAVVTHTNCSDGRACAALFLHAGVDPGDIYFVTAGEPYKADLLALLKGKRVVLADVSPADAKNFDLLKAAVASLVILDHHASAHEHFSGRPEFRYSDTVSGCAMVLEYLDKLSQGGKCPNLEHQLAQLDRRVFEHISKRDTFTFESGSPTWAWSLSLYAILYHDYANNLDAAEHILLVATSEEAYSHVTTDPYHAVAELERNCGELKSRAVVHDDHVAVDLSDNVALRAAISEGGHRLADAHKLPIVMYKGLEKGQHRYSVRGPDARVWAERHGGGGHDEAAAYATPQVISQQSV